jgi:cobalamin biosynthesis protein CobT
MKLIFALLTSLALVGTAYAGGEVKEVCKDKVGKDGKTVMDKKTNKPVQECKKIKVHKKVEGEKVPEPAKKK